MIALKIVAVALAGMSLLATGFWWRQVRRSGGDTLVVVPVFMICIATLIGVLPGLLWPTNEPLQAVGSIASMLVTTVAMVVSIRRIKALRRQAEAKADWKPCRD